MPVFAFVTTCWYRDSANSNTQKRMRCPYLCEHVKRKNERKTYTFSLRKTGEQKDIINDLIEEKRTR